MLTTEPETITEAQWRIENLREGREQRKREREARNRELSIIAGWINADAQARRLPPGPVSASVQSIQT